MFLIDEEDVTKNSYASFFIFLVVLFPIGLVSI